MELFLIITYYSTLALLIGVATLTIVRQYTWAYYLRCAAIALSLTSLIGFYVHSGFLPVYNKFATLQNIVLLVLLASQYYAKRQHPMVSVLSSCTVVILQALVLCYEFTPDTAYYMYQKVYVTAFFQCRVWAMACFTLSSIQYAASLWLPDRDNDYPYALKQGRNFTLLGASFFLAGEFSGSYWCLQWWGDTWHWSKGFMLAMVVFLLSMLSRHVPLALFNKKPLQTLLNLFPPLGILSIYLLSH